MLCASCWVSSCLPVASRRMGASAPMKPSVGGSWASTPAVRAVMQGNRSRDTRPEVALRSAVHRKGLRYRVSVRPLPSLNRTADLVFRRAKVAVFVDGCYWHGCPEHYRLPSVNQEYWSAKVVRNVTRDRDTNDRLIESGWLPLRFWEHDDVATCAEQVRAAVRERLERR